MKINPNDLVLEVGSGDKPYPRSDVLLDKFPDNSNEREAGRALVVDRSLVIGEAEALPFADKSFDYIIASHVLEHSKYPTRFLDELSRVGKRGYIETPLPLRERVFDWAFHRWYVYHEGQKLILIKKTAKSKKFFAGMNQKKMVNLYALSGKKLPNLQFEWRRNIRYKILPSEPTLFLETLDKKLMILYRSKGHIRPANTVVSKINWFKDKLFPFKWKIGRAIKFWGRKRSSRVDLLSLLVCPTCKSNLQKKGSKLICVGCGRSIIVHQSHKPSESEGEAL